MQQKVDAIEQLKANPVQWQARVDLAAAHAALVRRHPGTRAFWIYDLDAFAQGIKALEPFFADLSTDLDAFAADPVV